MRVGFLGLGVMGTPMALNLLRNFPLTAWSRSPTKYPLLLQAGAKVAETPKRVVEMSDTIFTMLFNAKAIRSIFDESLVRALRGKNLINTSSVPASFSQELASQVQKAGGKFIEMPVSGSKTPAERGELVGMMADDSGEAERIRPVIEPITKAAVYCGPIGTGLKMKYATNLYLIVTTGGLAESMNLAEAQGLDLEAFAQVLDAGPMSSTYSRLKVNKVLHSDWSPQAAIKDCYNSTQLIQSASQSTDTASPLIHLCGDLYQQAIRSGLGEEDMIALIQSMRKIY